MHRPAPATGTTITPGTIALALVAVAAFAGNSLLARAALGSGLIGPGSLTALRLAAGALILLPIWLQGGRAWPLWPGAIALLAYCASFSFAYVQLGAATGAMLLFTAVQATVLLLDARAGKTLRAPDLAGIALALGGVAVLLAPGARAGPLLAMINMVAAGVAWGVYSVLGQQAGDPAQRTSGNFILAALLAAPLAGLDAGLPISARGAVLAAVSGAVTSALGYVLWYRLVPRLPQAAIGAVQLATPVLAAVAAALLLSEPLSLRLGVAALLILGGISLTLGRR